MSEEQEVTEEMIIETADHDDSPALDAYWAFLDAEDFVHGCLTWVGGQ